MAKEYAKPFGSNVTTPARPEGWTLEEAVKTGATRAEDAPVFPPQVPAQGNEGRRPQPGQDYPNL